MTKKVIKKYKKKENGKKDVGRKTKKTEEVVRNLEEIFKYDGTVTEACIYAGITRETYYDWLQKDKEFSDKMNKAKQYAFIMSRKTLISSSINGDEKSAIEFLKRRDRRYKDKQDIGGDEDNPIKVELKLDGATMAELEEMRKKLLG